MAEFDMGLPGGIVKKVDGRFVRTEYVPAQTIEHIVETKEVIAEMVVGAIMNVGGYRGLAFQPQVMQMGDVFEYFSKIKDLAKEGGIELGSVKKLGCVRQLVAGEARAAIDDRLREALVGHGEVNKDVIRSRARDSAVRVLAVGLFEDFVDGVMTADKVTATDGPNIWDKSNPLGFRQSDYEKGIMLKFNTIIREREEFAASLIEK